MSTTLCVCAPRTSARPATATLSPPPRHTSALASLRRIAATSNLRGKTYGPQDLQTYLATLPPFAHVTPACPRRRQEPVLRDGRWGLRNGGWGFQPRAQGAEKRVTRDILGNVWVGDDGGRGFRWSDRELRGGAVVMPTIWEEED